jgi:predicted transcriptional regulator
LAKIATGAVTPAEPPAPTPAVTVRQSIKPDYLVCLDDGKKFKSLRRHLATLGMTPEQYRVKWNLPADYPMVAANYAAQRSELAKKIGLGQSRRANATVKPKRGRAAKAAT